MSNNIFAVDTATSGLSLSLLLKCGNLIIKNYDDMRGQAQVFIPLVLEMLKEASISFKDIDVLASATGPGSFTGIRVGLSAMQGISLAAEIPLIGYDNFAIHSYDYEVPKGKDLLVALESHREESFFQIYDEHGDRCGEPFQVEVENIYNFVSIDKEYIVIGDAKKTINSLSRKEGFISPSLDSINNGSENICYMLQDRLSGANSNLVELERRKPAIPFYIRPPDVTISNK